MQIKYLNHKEILDLLPERKKDAHKGNFGKLLMLCGSRGYTGAPELAAKGALRCGAGLVYLGVPECVYNIMAVKLTEPIVFPLPDEGGMFSHLVAANISENINRYQAVLVGPGMGCSVGCFEVVKAVLANYNGPVILDADGINVLQGHIDLLRGRKFPTILTPHPGEFERINGTAPADRLTDAKQLAKNTNTIVLLKGHRTVITDGSACYVNTTGNPGMAVGGSGDLLAGMILGLLGQGLKPLEATACAAWLHGKVGDICANQLGQYAMLPTDMLEVLPRLLK